MKDSKGNELESWILVGREPGSDKATIEWKGSYNVRLMLAANLVADLEKTGKA